jgi:hypothetical protein
VGPYVTFTGTTVQYQTDTTGGNSGSPIILEDLGVAIGVHTNGGCDSGGGQNSGTGVNNVGLQYALANPQGVCIPIAPLGFGVVGGLPELLDPAGDSFTVLVWGQEGGIPQPGTGMLHYDLGAGFVAQPMIETNPNVYQANFPALDCPTYVSFYFSAETTEGELVTDPLGAPDDHHEALAAVDVEYAFDDDFETEQGWTVQDSPTLTAGSWDRGAPVGGGDRGDPPTDADGSGQCALTGNQDGDSDVDDGSTTLISPIMDATDPTSVIAYYRWYHNTYGGDPANDIFEVDVSDNGGASWTNLETVGPAGPQVSGGWFHVEFVVADIPGGNFNTDQFRIRFTASDLGGGSVVEAGIDGVQLKRIICGEPPVPGDANGDGVVDVLDLLAVIAAWGQSGVAEDVNGDGIVDVLDLLFVIANWS